MGRKPRRIADYLRRYPRILAQIMADSHGLLTVPRVAAEVLRDAKEGRKNYSAFVWCCYHGDPKLCITRAIEYRHSHKDSLRYYKAIIREANQARPVHE